MLIVSQKFISFRVQLYLGLRMSSNDSNDSPMDIGEISPEEVDSGDIKSIRSTRQKERDIEPDDIEIVEIQSKKRVVYSKIIVDLRRTKLHLDEWGIKLDDQRRAKNRQWTKDMDLIGEVTINDKKYGKLGIRENVWKEKDPCKRLFVMKLFSQKFNWKGSIEMLQGDSVTLSYTTHENCPVYNLNISGTLNLIKLRKMPHKPRFRGETFAFDLVDEKSAIHRTFIIDDKRLTFGDDWYVYDMKKGKVAYIDGRFMNLGGRYDIEIYDKELSKTKEFYNTLILFSSTLRYYKNIKKTIRATIHKIKKENSDLKLRESEADLYLNPRKINY